MVADVHRHARNSARPTDPTSLGRILRDWFATPNGLLAFSGMVFFTVYAAWLLLSGPSEHRVLMADLWNLPLGVAAGVAAWVTSRAPGLEPRLSRAWQLGSLAFFCDTLGNTWWLVSANLLSTTPIASAPASPA